MGTGVGALLFTVYFFYSILILWTMYCLFKKIKLKKHIVYIFKVQETDTKPLSISLYGLAFNKLIH